jgi:arylsulfatase A-like enzyme
MRSIQDERFHYILRGDGEEELYAYRDDREEVRNLADAPQARQELARLRALLASPATRQ